MKRLTHVIVLNSPRRVGFSLHRFTKVNIILKTGFQSNIGKDQTPELSSTRTVRKSDYTPALALPKHMAGIFEEKCREKEKYREEQIGECPFSIQRHNLPL